jgi:hypothetical protein
LDELAKQLNSKDANELNDELAALHIDNIDQNDGTALPRPVHGIALHRLLAAEPPTAADLQKQIDEVKAEQIVLQVSIEQEDKWVAKAKAALPLPSKGAGTFAEAAIQGAARVALGYRTTESLLTEVLKREKVLEQNKVLLNGMATRLKLLELELLELQKAQAGARAEPLQKDAPVVADESEGVRNAATPAKQIVESGEKTVFSLEIVCKVLFKFFMISLNSAKKVVELRTEEKIAEFHAAEAAKAEAADGVAIGVYTHALEQDRKITDWRVFKRDIDPNNDGGMWHKYVKYMYSEHAPWTALTLGTPADNHEMSVFVKNYAKYVLKLGNLNIDTKLTYTYHPTSGNQHLKVVPRITVLRTWELAFQQSGSGDIRISYKGHEVPCNTVECHSDSDFDS